MSDFPIQKPGLIFVGCSLAAFTLSDYLTNLLMGILLGLMCFIGEMMTDQWMQRDTEVYSEKAKGVKSQGTQTLGGCLGSTHPWDLGVRTHHIMYLYLSKVISCRTQHGNIKNTIPRSYGLQPQETMA